MLPENLLKFYNIRAQADYECYAKHDYHTAKKLCEEAMEIKLEPNIIHTYIAVCAHLKLYTETKKWIEYTIVNYNTELKLYTLFKEFGLTETNAVILAVKDEEDSLKKIFLTHEKDEFIRQFEGAFQCYMIAYKAKALQIRWDDSVLVSNIKRKYSNKPTEEIKRDCIEPFVKSTIDNYLYPTESEIGNQNLYYWPSLFLIADIKNKRDILDKALYQGKIQPYDYAYIFDRNFKYNNTYENCYGTKLKMVNHKATLDDIPDIKNVNERRKKIGLPPITANEQYELSEQYKQYFKETK